MKFLTLGTVIYLIYTICSCTPAAAADVNKISASSGAIHIDWSGNHGILNQDAFDGKSAEHYGLTYLRTDIGPKGSADYLVWLLARDNSSFKIVWGYMNRGGSSFWAWIYHYPENIVTLSEFKGSYSINSLSTSYSRPDESRISLGTPPGYTGQPFKFQDWSADHGKISRLSTTLPSISKGKEIVLTDLSISPLHEISVPAMNGWRDRGWQELHAVATDSKNNPYYLILYSNSQKGYIINLDGGWAAPADYGEVVNFIQPTSASTPSSTELDQEATVAEQANPEPNNKLLLQIPRFRTFEAKFETNTPYKNPFIEQQMDVDLLGPDGKEYSAMGYWAGKSTWAFRFSPQMAGVWQWRTISQDKSLDGHEGAFECIPLEMNAHGFLKKDKTGQESIKSVWTDGAPFMPTTARTNFCNFKSNLNAASWLDALYNKGVDRLSGGFILDSIISKTTKQAVLPLIASDPSQLNQEYFSLLDQIVQLATEKGILLEIGLSSSKSGALSAFKEDELRNIWRYIIARYSSYNITWKVFDDDAIADSSARKNSSFEEMLRLYDLNQHPVGGLNTQLIREEDDPVWQKIWEAVMSTKLPAVQISDPSTPVSERQYLNLSKLASCTKLLKNTRFWRLNPHQDLFDNYIELKSVGITPDSQNDNKLIADPGWEYMLWLPQGGSAMLDLVEAAGHLKAVWYNPKTDVSQYPENLSGAAHLKLSAPDNDPWILHLTRR